MTTGESQGPLRGLRVVEIGGIGPLPHASMILADLGADVVRVDRADAIERAGSDHVLRRRRLLALHLKNPDDRDALLSIVDKADVLLEGFRPGVAERLGFGPDVALERNPRLVYGRMTGWGQEGPLAERAGHDINYISITGVLHAIGQADQPPPPPLNLVGDFGGGSMLLVQGVLAALFERNTSGQGQVIDTAMVDGASLLAQSIFGLRANGRWTDERADNLLDSGAPYYGAYVCADGKFLSVGAIEPQFYALLLEGLGIDPASLPDQNDKAAWPQMKATFAEVIKTRTRDEWAAQFDGTDACVAPVLSFAEAPTNPHLKARSTHLVTEDGATVVAPAPRFSRTDANRSVDSLASASATADDVLTSWA